MAIIKSVSINLAESEFIEQHDLSLSKLLQDKIHEIMENFKISEKYVQEQSRKLGVLQKVVDKQRDFIEANGLMEQFAQNV
jgi:hypothetical protein